MQIYLGAAPGMGKTFAMLGEAHRRLEQGTDVVVGLVKTHDRVKIRAEETPGGGLTMVISLPAETSDSMARTTRHII